MKTVERVLERRIRELVDVDEMQFDFMLGRGTTDTLFFFVKRMHEEYEDKESNL